MQEQVVSQPAQPAKEVTGQVRLPPMRVRRFALSGPDSVAILRLLDRFKKGYARSPIAREHAVSILQAACVPNNNIEAQVFFITKHVREKMTYVRDPNGAEYIVSPLRLIASIKNSGSAYGDCDDHALLLNTLLTSIGVETRFLGVKIGGSDVYNHVVCSANVRGEWKDIDPCAKKGDEPQYQERLVI